MSCYIRVNYINSPRCECGYHHEDINHLLIFQCSNYDDVRIDLNYNLNMVSASDPD